jgi:hypothetical protein
MNQKRRLNFSSCIARVRLFTGLLAGFFLSGTCAYSADGTTVQEPLVHASFTKQPTSPVTLVNSKNWNASQSLYYKRNWGVEVIGVRPASSGYMLDFRYRIVDPVKARPLNDMKGKAYLVDEASGTRLAVPALENVGELRTGTDPKVNRTYFMIFGNPGRLVKPGSRVSVVIGNFHVDGLIVN